MDNETHSALMETGNFIHNYIREDLGEHTERLVTRFPPEPNGYLHIGHAKGFCTSFGLAEAYGGRYNLRFDDTNPAKEDTEYVNSIIEDIRWLGFELTDKNILFASDYFGKIYDCAVKLIKDGKAYVCDLTADEVREYRGDLKKPGKESPYRGRTAEENLDLFTRMREGEFPDGARTLRLKIDMSSPNMNMRDPVIYRIAHISHHNTGDEWCIYPMYDFAHPLEDAIEGVTHSICSLEFEDHRPLYNWIVDQFDFDPKPRQIEYAKLFLTNTVMGKRYLRRLVEDGVVDGWDDPRMVTLVGLRRRGYTPSAIREFLDKVGVAKANTKVDYAFLDYVQREDIKDSAKVVMAVLDPVKLVITNYPEGKTETVTLENNQENPGLGTREAPFGRELYIERGDFMEDAPSKYHRLSPGREVRLKGAYFVTCTGAEKDADGNVTAVYCTYDPETRSGSGFDGRKVKGTIHWVEASNAVPIRAMLYDSLVIDDDSEQKYHENPDSLIVMDKAVAEPCLKHATAAERYQFMRTGYFCRDSKHENELVFNRICPLKSSFKI